MRIHQKGIRLTDQQKAIAVKAINSMYNNVYEISIIAGGFVVEVTVYDKDKESQVIGTYDSKDHMLGFFEGYAKCTEHGFVGPDVDEATAKYVLTQFDKLDLNEAATIKINSDNGLSTKWLNISSDIVKLQRDVLTGV